jgi:phage shock protein C
MKNLYRSTSNRMLAGVLGGIGEYLNVDPVILRISWIAVTVFSGFVPGAVVYFMACLIIPEKSSSGTN